eukprot:CAMPEP_0115880090 /NCGR_PEP_ID=MMETSP0287-20121206/27682_1 /TAXON_ID=412157 /ORGANISM="Chrysochromulina rotalis, Strain UIO044" /LENGTH=91 /DNA_ID=CAMNT_0003335871 /DNA_START=240 /DNA_END=512 /DNA_ORIENTATION=+
MGSPSAPMTGDELSPGNHEEAGHAADPETCASSLFSVTSPKCSLAALRLLPRSGALASATQLKPPARVAPHPISPSVQAALQERHVRCAGV